MWLLTAAYTRETVALGDVVEKYFTLDPFDPERTKIVKVSNSLKLAVVRRLALAWDTSLTVTHGLQTIKTDGAAWASKYARGGSARKQSARKFYIVVDALQGHITSNGTCRIRQVYLPAMLRRSQSQYQNIKKSERQKFRLDVGFVRRLRTAAAFQGEDAAEECGGDEGAVGQGRVGKLDVGVIANEHWLRERWNFAVRRSIGRDCSFRNASWGASPLARGRYNTAMIF